MSAKFSGYFSVLFVRDPERARAFYQELSAKGVEFIRPPEDRSWGLRCAHFKDPDGHVWEIHTPLSEQS